MTRVILEPAAPRSRVKHSTTEPLCSQKVQTSLQNYFIIDSYRSQIEKGIKVTTAIHVYQMSRDL